MNERVKGALPRFIGGAIGGCVAALMDPTLWWLGMVAGYAAGYVAYEFRAVLRALPIAARATWTGAPKALRAAGNFVRVFASREFAFAHISFLATFATIEWLLPSHYPIVLHSFFFCIGLLVAALITGFMEFFAEVGAMFVENTGWESRSEYSDWYNSLYKTPPTHADITHLRALRWTIEGIIALPASILALLGYVCYKVVKHTTILIHSHKRVLCGFHAAFGTGIAWMLLGAHHAHPALIALCGGCIGAGIGLATWQIASAFRTTNT